jgi:hypothetical protein
VAANLKQRNQRCDASRDAHGRRQDVIDHQRGGSEQAGTITKVLSRYGVAMRRRLKAPDAFANHVGSAFDTRIRSRHDTDREQEIHVDWENRHDAAHVPDLDCRFASLLTQGSS